jgi:hypothetical protein
MTTIVIPGLEDRSFSEKDNLTLYTLFKLYERPNKNRIMELADFLSEKRYNYTFDQPMYSVSNNCVENFAAREAKEILDSSNTESRSYLTLVNGTEIFSPNQKPGILRINILYIDISPAYIPEKGIRGWLFYKKKIVNVNMHNFHIRISPTFLPIHKIYDT